MRESLRQRKRDEIRDAAVPLFAANGIDGTSMQDIAGAAEVAVATVYNHFAGKNEIIAAAISFALTELLEQVREVYDSHPDTVDAIRETHRVYAHFCHHRRDILKVAIKVRDKEDWPEANAIKAELFALSESAIRRGIKAGQLVGADADLCAKVQSAVANVLLMEAVEKPADYPEDRLAGLIDQFVFHGLQVSTAGTSGRKRGTKER